jgi:ATP-binding cassette subfamily C protein CydC
MSALLPSELADCATPWRTTRRMALAAAIVVAVSTVGLLALSGWFITAAAIAGAAGPMAARAFNYLIPSALIRLLAILRTAMRYVEQLLSHRASLSTLAAVRTRLFAKAAAAEAQGALRLSGGEAATLLGADVDQIEDRLIRGPALAGALASSVCAVGLGLIAGPACATAIALCLGLAVLGTRLSARHLLPHRAEAVAAALGALKVALTEHSAAAGEIAVYGLTQRVSSDLERLSARHDAAVADLTRAEAMVAMFIPAGAGLASAFAVVMANGGAAFAAAAALAAAAAGEGLAALGRAHIKAPSIESAFDRLRQLAVVVERPPPPAATAIPELIIAAGGALHSLAPGARVALVGRSGTGKTRLLETLAGIRRDSPERLLVGGEGVATLGLYRLRPVFALVPQNPMVVTGTVLDNLRIARPGLTEAQLWEALAVARLEEEVRSFPDGLNQWIGEAGLALSGGQRKRLALARGLLAQRPWLLLDEPTEGIDAETEGRIVAELRAWFDHTGCGLLLVSHRPEPLTLCNRIIHLAEEER